MLVKRGNSILSDPSKMAPTKNVATEESRIFTPAHPLPAFRETANAEPSITLADQAYEQIEELIVTGQLSPMSFITEARLQGQLGIGRTPIREAFQRLEVDELVVIVPRRGVMVTDIDFRHHMQEIGRASCRERVCKYV